MSECEAPACLTVALMIDDDDKKTWRLLTKPQSVREASHQPFFMVRLPSYLSNVSALSSSG